MLASAMTATTHPSTSPGGVLLLSFAALALSGHSWSLPTFVRAPDPERGDSAGVFALGVFSGVASSCCAHGPGRGHDPLGPVVDTGRAVACSGWPMCSG